MGDYGKYIEGHYKNYSFEIWCKNWIGDFITPECLNVDGLTLNGLLSGDLTTDNRIVKSTLDISFKATKSLYKQYFDRFFHR